MMDSPPFFSRRLTIQVQFFSLILTRANFGVHALKQFCQCRRSLNKGSYTGINIDPSPKKFLGGKNDSRKKIIQNREIPQRREI